MAALAFLLFVISSFILQAQTSPTNIHVHLYGISFDGRSGNSGGGFEGDWNKSGVAATFNSKHLLPGTEDGTAEYSGNMDNPDEYQKAADYCFKGLKPCGWGKKALGEKMKCLAEHNPGHWNM